MQALSASGPRYNVMRVASVRKSGKPDRPTSSSKGFEAWNDAKVGADMTKSGRAFQARAATNGNARPPSVARRVTGTISDDDEDDRRRRCDWTSVTR